MLGHYLVSAISIFTAELGDKTQIVVFCLATRYGWLSVLIGAMLGFALINGPVAFIGIASLKLLPERFILRLSGLLFILFGMFLLWRRDICEIPAIDNPADGLSEEVLSSERSLLGRLRGVIGKHNGFLTAFSLIFLAELGDKTQLGTLILAARFGEFWAVYLGVITALALSTVIGIVLGRRICSILPPGVLSYISSGIFILIGVYTLFHSYFHF